MFLFSVLGVMIVSLIMILIAPILGALFGGIAGWAVGLFFEGTIRTFLFSFGVDVAHLSMFQIGAALGFIGSFFKSTPAPSKDK